MMIFSPVISAPSTATTTTACASVSHSSVARLDAATGPGLSPESFSLIAYWIWIWISALWRELAWYATINSLSHCLESSLTLVFSHIPPEMAR